MILVAFCYTALLFFFFFKQKTAYEMRISDWSSDVALPISNPQHTIRAPPSERPRPAAARSRAHAQLSTVAEPRERRGHIVREVDDRRVDERDGSWEDRSPRFRVYLFVRGVGGDYSGRAPWGLS